MTIVPRHSHPPFKRRGREKKGNAPPPKKGGTGESNEMENRIIQHELGEQLGL